MPTGYTADLYEGKPTTFEEFVWTCARAFGALILMRDDPADAPIPEKFEPSDYHVKALIDAEEHLIELRAMTPEEMTQAYLDERATILAQRAKDIRRRRDIKQRYESMLAEVKAWEPPTPDHQGLKDFMREQIEKAIDFDCTGSIYPDLPPEDPAEWWTQKLDKAEWSVAYHRKAHADEVERTEGRNAWVRALRQSLAPESALSSDESTSRDK